MGVVVSQKYDFRWHQAVHEVDKFICLARTPKCDGGTCCIFTLRQQEYLDGGVGVHLGSVSSKFGNLSIDCAKPNNTREMRCRFLEAASEFLALFTPKIAKVVCICARL